MADRPRFISAYERRQRIEALLKVRGITWFKLAELAGTYPSTLYHGYRVQPHEKRDISLRSLTNIAKALGVTAGFLIDRKETDHD